jgi:D-threo-aldose 1-dehydrogenase
MKQRKIGRCDLSVTDISFGCASIGNLYHAISDKEALSVLNAAWRAGIRYFDTAPHYGRGRSEMRLGNFLASKNRAKAVISTKVGRVLFPGPQMASANGFIDPLSNDVRFDYSANGIAESFAQSCERLQTDVIDIVYIHDIGEMTHGADNARHFSDLMTSGLDELLGLKRSGRIKAFGLGVNETQVCLDVMDEVTLDVILLAGRLTLLERTAEKTLTERCQRAGTSLVLGGVFNSGILATGPVEGSTYNYKPASDEIKAKVRTLQDRAAVRGLDLATAALHFAHSYPGVASTLIATGREDMLKRNLDALARPVDQADLRAIAAPL